MYNGLKDALRGLEELLWEVDAGYFIPIRFRKMQFKRFVEVERPKYVSYLKREVADLKSRMKAEANRAGN